MFVLLHCIGRFHSSQLFANLKLQVYSMPARVARNTKKTESDVLSPKAAQSKGQECFRDPS